MRKMVDWESLELKTMIKRQAQQEVYGEAMEGLARMTSQYVSARPEVSVDPAVALAFLTQDIFDDAREAVRVMGFGQNIDEVLANPAFGFSAEVALRNDIAFNNPLINAARVLRGREQIFVAGIKACFGERGCDQR